MSGFIAQLVEQRNGNAEVTGSNLVEALIFFFRLLLSNCLNWKIYCADHSSLSSTTAVQKWIISYTSHQCYVSQHGVFYSISRWSPDFFSGFSFQLLKLENLLRWSFFTLIYNRSSKMNYIIYFTSVLCKLTLCILFHVVTCDYRAWKAEIIPFVLRVHQTSLPVLDLS